MPPCKSPTDAAMVRRGVFRFDGLTVAPGLSAGDLAEQLKGRGDVRRVALKTAAVYLTAVRWQSECWEVHITVREGAVRQLDLRLPPGDPAEIFAAQNNALCAALGNDFQKTLGRRTCRFPWGSVCSRMDIQTGECLISVDYSG